MWNEEKHIRRTNKDGINHFRGVDAVASRLKINSREEDGVLQRIVFELSKRNIEVGGMLYVRGRRGLAIHITLDEADAKRVIRHMMRIYGVTEARIVNEGNIEG